MAGLMGIKPDIAQMALQQRSAPNPGIMASINALPAGGARDAAARKTASEFEAMFLTQMLQHMSAGIKTDGPFGGGQGEEMFRSLLNQEYAGALSRRGGIGIADSVYRQILALQEIQP